MEHRLITGGYEFLPFARSCITKLKKLGLPYANQSYEVGGVSIKVRIEPGHEYIRIEGGSGSYLCLPHSEEHPDGVKEKTLPDGTIVEVDPEAVITIMNEATDPTKFKYKVKENVSKQTGSVDWKGGEKGKTILSYDPGTDLRYRMPGGNRIPIAQRGIYEHGVRHSTEHGVMGAAKLKLEAGGTRLIYAGQFNGEIRIFIYEKSEWMQVGVYTKPESTASSIFGLQDPVYFSPDGRRFTTLLSEFSTATEANGSYIYSDQGFTPFAVYALRGNVVTYEDEYGISSAEVTFTLGKNLISYSLVRKPNPPYQGGSLTYETIATGERVSYTWSPEPDGDGIVVQTETITLSMGTYKIVEGFQQIDTSAKRLYSSPIAIDYSPSGDELHISVNAEYKDYTYVYQVSQGYSSFWTFAGEISRVYAYEHHVHAEPESAHYFKLGTDTTEQNANSAIEALNAGFAKHSRVQVTGSTDWAKTRTLNIMVNGELLSSISPLIDIVTNESPELLSEVQIVSHLDARDRTIAYSVVKTKSDALSAEIAITTPGGSTRNSMGSVSPSPVTLMAGGDIFTFGYPVPSNTPQHISPWRTNLWFVPMGKTYAMDPPLEGCVYASRKANEWVVSVDTRLCSKVPPEGYCATVYGVDYRDVTNISQEAKDKLLAIFKDSLFTDIVNEVKTDSNPEAKFSIGGETRFSFAPITLI